MDILISSNLERLLFHLADEDDSIVRQLMEDLKNEGRYTVPQQVLSRLQADFAGGFSDEEETAATIKRLFDTYSYLCDTHTAVAVSVHEDYCARTGDDTKTVIASTANPFKFPHAVLTALGGKTQGADEFEIAQKLEEISGCEMPNQLAGLREKTVRFTETFSKNRMDDALTKALQNV